MIMWGNLQIQKHPFPNGLQPLWDISTVNEKGNSIYVAVRNSTRKMILAMSLINGNTRIVTSLHEHEQFISIIWDIKVSKLLIHVHDGVGMCIDHRNMLYI